MAAGMIAPVLADVAVTSARCLLQRRHHRLLVASLLRRQLVSAAGSFPAQAGHRESPVPDMAGSGGGVTGISGMRNEVQGLARA
jgi:hypothetical protein